MNEQILLRNALQHEEGHKRRTEHILKVYALTRVIALSENVTDQELAIVSAAAILHDIPIKRCKEEFGDASMPFQQKLAPEMVSTMLKEAGYPESFYEDVLDLVMHHHDYHSISSPLLRILMEADLLVNYMEDKGHESPKDTQFIFQSVYAKDLFDYFANER